MDVNTLIPTTVPFDHASLVTTGSITAQKTQSNETIIRNPGLSKATISLIDGLSKPILHHSFLLNSSFTDYSFLIDANTFQVNPHFDRLQDLYMSPLYNMVVIVHISGHQFCVAKLGVGFTPLCSYAGDTWIPNYPGPAPNGPTNAGARNVYNFIRNINGAFISVSDSANSVTTKCLLPRTVPFNNYNAGLVPPSYGKFHLLTVGTPRFTMDVSNVTVRILIAMTDVVLNPFFPS